MGSGGFFDAAGANAGRANAHVALGSADDGAHAAEIGIPAAPARVVRVADHIAKLRGFPAEFTLHGHKSFLLTYVFSRKLTILADRTRRDKEVAWCGRTT